MAETRRAPVLLKHPLTGRVTRAVLPNEKVVERQEYLVAQAFGHAFIPVTPDSYHFIYEIKLDPNDPSTFGPAKMCTCGAEAIILGHTFNNGVLLGGQWVCAYFAKFGSHTNTEARWV